MTVQTARPKSLLFVDDEPDFLSGLTELFPEMGQGSWEIATAENHARALELLSEKRMDLVVLDIGMPVMDGIQFIRLLDRTHREQQVVILTGRPPPKARKP
jgi:two-component system response regulator YesN